MDDFNTPTDEQVQQAKNAIKEVAQLYHIIFTSEQGQKVFAHLNNMTKGSSLSGNDMMDANVNVSPSEFMFMREGQDQVVRHIARMLKYYQEN